MENHLADGKLLEISINTNPYQGLKLRLPQSFLVILLGFQLIQIPIRDWNLYFPGEAYSVAISINTNPYQGLKLSGDIGSGKSWKISINTNPYQGLKQ